MSTFLPREEKLDNLPDGLTPPEGRSKPWGTGHAVMVTEDKVQEPFAVVNAVTGTTADVSWTEDGTATQWEVEYDTAGLRVDCFWSLP